MKRPHLLNRLLAHPRLALALAALVALGVALLGCDVYRRGAEQDLRRELELHAGEVAARLRSVTLQGQALGALSLAGRALAEIRSATLTDAASASLAGQLETLGRSFDGQGVFILNGVEQPIAGWDSHGAPVAAQLSSRRPYFAQAMAGKPSVYAAVSANTGERTLYLAAPVFASAAQGAAVTGVVVGRTGLDGVDRMLAESGRIGLLLSPQGVVFASSRAEWRLRLAGPADEERLAGIARLQQFGRSFEGGRAPQGLPFDVDAGKVRVDGRRHALADASLDWNDAAGAWRVLLLEDLGGAVPQRRQLALGALLWLGCFVLLVSLFKTLKDIAARRSADEASRHATRQLARQAEAKTRQAEFAASLQQARDLQSLARVVFARLAEGLPVHQATLYVRNVAAGKESELLLADAYACENAPERVEAGDGLVGQCALDGRPMIFDEPPQGFWRVRSGLGSAAPRALLLQPIVRNERLLGVLEVASLAPDGATQLAQIDDLLPVLGANLEVLLATLRMEAALEEARAQAEQARRGEDFKRELEIWYHGVIDGAPDAMLVVNAEGVIVLANLAAEHLFEYERGALNGLAVEVLVPPAVRAAHVEMRAGFVGGSGGRTRMAGDRAHVGGVTRDGRELRLAISLARLPNLPQRGACTCAVIRPVDDAHPGD